MKVYRNIGLTAFAVMTIALLVYFSRDQEDKTRMILLTDSVAQVEEIEVGLSEAGNEAERDTLQEMTVGEGLPVNANKPSSPVKVKSEEFLGKSFSQCMEMVYAWPDAQVFGVDDDNEGIEIMNFVVNKHHHELSFENGICKVDEILKK